MNKIINTFLIALFSVSYVSYSQQNTDSPYSYYGIGELASKASTEESLMGGIGSFADTIRVNRQNPATLSRLKFTAFSAGISMKTKKIVSNVTNVNTEATSVDYITLGFPITKKLGLSAGLSPYSSVGYKLLSRKVIDGATHLSSFEGKGNVNQTFLAAGYQIYKGLSLGVGLNFNFGKIEMNDALSISNVQFTTSEYSQSLLRGFSSNFGLYYEQNIKHRLKFSSSLVYNPEGTLTSKNQRTVSVHSLENNVSVQKAQSSENLAKLGLHETKLTIPMQIRMGAGIGEEQKWYTAVEYTFEKNSSFSNPFLSTTNLKYDNGYKFSVGGFYIPQYNSFTSYWKRVTYRAGMKYEKTGIVINNTSIDDFGISFGVTVPVTRSFSNITLGVEYGKRGTTSQNLVKENYFNLKVGFSLNDKWFQKTKYQ